MVRRKDTRSDRQLVEVCNTGDGKEATLAFQALYERHKQYVLHVARRYSGNTDASLDVLQDVFSEILQRFPPPGPGIRLSAKFTTFLYAITRNVAINQQRKSRTTSQVSIDPDSLSDDEDAPGVTDDFDGLLRGITEQERELVAMRFVDDLKVSEIADILEIPAGTVKSRLHKAVSRLRNSPHLKDYFEK